MSHLSHTQTPHLWRSEVSLGTPCELQHLLLPEDPLAAFALEGQDICQPNGTKGSIQGMESIGQQRTANDS